MTVLNILFITYNEVTPQRGGIERMTDILVNHLSTLKGIKCFSAFYQANDLSHTLFEDKIHLQRGEEKRIIIQFIRKKDINVIINQQVPALYRLIHPLKKDLLLHYIYVQHDRVSLKPKIFDVSVRKFYSELYEHDKKRKLEFELKFLWSSILPFLRQIYYSYVFNVIYNRADYIVLLSSFFVKPFLRKALLRRDLKKRIQIVNNCITLPLVANTQHIKTKQKEVLIVSRLTESRKRISLALKIWKLYQSTYPEAKEWSLRIIGNGNCASDYQYWVEKNNVPNIYFEGQVDDTIEFYLSAAVFMMTSDSEGWGLTLMEAQQMGCVPIAFNSYESIREIIQDGVNGFLVKEMNIEDFVEKLHILTINTDIRTSMAVNGLEVINRFSVNRMIGKWLDILQQFKG